MTNEDKMPFTVSEFRSSAQTSVKYFQFQIPFKKIEKDYLIYRGKGWSLHPKLKTFIFLPGTAYVNLNMANSDVAYPGILSFLPSEYQIIVPIFPNAPENKFPTPLTHLQRTISTLLEKKDDYMIDERSIILGGFSCGATMTVPLALHFTRRGLPFNNLLYISPIFDYSGELMNQQGLKKWEHFEKQDNKLLTFKFIQFMNEHYSNTQQDLYDPRYSPIFTSIEDLSSLKHNLFVYGEFDFMRRTIEEFKNKLTQAKVSHETQLLTGEGHRSLVLMRNRSVVPNADLEKQIKEMKMLGLKKIAQCIKKLL